MSDGHILLDPTGSVVGYVDLSYFMIVCTSLDIVHHSVITRYDVFQCMVIGDFKFLRSH